MPFFLRVSGVLVCVLLGGFAPLFSAFAEEGILETEKDIPLKNIGTLQMTNAYGPISVQGWSLDRIRIKIRKRWRTDEPLIFVKSSPYPETLQKQLDSLDVQILSQKDRIEVIGSAGHGLSIEDKLKFRKQALPVLELVVRAPSHLALQLFASHPEGVKVSAWSANVEIQGTDGSIDIQEVSSRNSQIACSGCVLSGRALSGKWKFFDKAGTIDLKDVKSDALFAETESGSIVLRDFRGKASLVSETGEVRVNRFAGEVDFRTKSAPVQLSEGRGTVLGGTESGDIHAEMSEWRNDEKTAVQSESGSIHLTLPDVFSGELDVGSESGKVFVGFALMNNQEKEVYGPIPPNRFKGAVGTGLGELVRVFSKTGSVWVLKGM